MTILETIKIKNMLDDLVNAKEIGLKEFKFHIEKLGYLIHKLEVQTSSVHNDARLIVKDINNKYYTIGV
jgi:hypothetical protein